MSSILAWLVISLVVCLGLAVILVIFLTKENKKEIENKKYNKLNLLYQIQNDLHIIITEIKEEPTGGYELSIPAKKLLSDVLESKYFKSLIKDTREGIKDE